MRADNIASGGWRQSLANPKPRSGRSRSPPTVSLPGEPNRKPPSSLAQSLLLDWGGGALSTPHLRRHCRSSVADSRANNSKPAFDVLTLSSIGGISPSTQNCQRDLMTLLNSLEFSRLVRAVDGKHIQYCVPPNDLLQFLLSRFPQSTARCLGVNEHLVQRFWTGLWESEMGKDLFREHPALVGKTPPGLCRAVPLSLHEDAGPFSKKNP